MAYIKLANSILICFIILCTYYICDAAQFHDVHIEWTYDDSNIGVGMAITDFKLYRDSENVCTWDTRDISLREGDCIFFAEPGEHNFTLTAIANDDIESAHSLQYPFTLKVTLPTPIMHIKITVR